MPRFELIFNCAGLMIGAAFGMTLLAVADGNRLLFVAGGTATFVSATMIGAWVAVYFMQPDEKENMP